MQKILIDYTPWCQEFRNKIKNSRHYKTIEQWDKNINIPLEETVYYNEMLGLLETNGPLWDGIISKKEDIVETLKNFKKLYLEYEEVLDERAVHYDKNVEWYYGDYPAQIMDNGNIRLYDGHHRIAIRLFKDYQLYVNICEIDLEWKKITNELYEMYGGKSLYQPIPHPSFIDWECSYDELLTNSLIKFVEDNDIKSVLDVGCCHAYNLYRVANYLDYGTAIEYDEVRSEIVKHLMSKLGLNSYSGNVIDFLKEDSTEFDCIFATAIFHHIAKQSSKEEFDYCLYELGKRSKFLMYTLPVDGEFQYAWINDYPNLDDYIIEKTGKKVIKKIKLRTRELTILK